MAGHSVKEIDNDIKRYIKVFIALLVMTALTVAVSYLHVGVGMAVAIGMAIAITKGTLVAGFFMHLFGEKKIIFITLIFMAIFFFVLLLLPVLVSMDKVGY